MQELSSTDDNLSVTLILLYFFRQAGQGVSVCQVVNFIRRCCGCRHWFISGHHIITLIGVLGRTAAAQPFYDSASLARVFNKFVAGQLETVISSVTPHVEKKLHNNSNWIAVRF